LTVTLSLYLSKTCTKQSLEVHEGIIWQYVILDFLDVMKASSFEDGTTSGE